MNNLKLQLTWGFARVVLLSCFCLIILLFFSYDVQSQTAGIKIKGKVTDIKGEPLPSVNVRVKGSNTGTLTNVNGEFSITVPSKQSLLIFSFMGFQEREISASSVDGKGISLKESTSVLDEVVVIGYGAVAKRDLTGSVGKANINDMQKAPVASFDQALAGRIAGVNVSSSDGQPGAASQITIRGSSVTQDASPLYVIDGFPVENMDVNSINMNDIESIEVLKDASSIAIYGARGANGVIIITSKVGKVGPPKINYNFNYAIQDDLNRVEMLNPYEFVKLQLELDSIRSTGVSKVNTNKMIYLGFDPLTGNSIRDLESYRNEAGYDWQDILLRTGIQQTHSLNLSGGTSDTRYSVSGSIFDQRGIIINTGLKKYDGRISLDQKINKNIKIGIKSFFSNTESFGTVPTSGNGGGVVQGMRQYRPVSGVGNQDLLNSEIDSTAIDDFINGAGNATLGANLVNPLAQAENEYRSSIRNTTSLNGFLEYAFLKKFKLRLSGGYNGTEVKNENFYNSKTQQGNLYTNLSGAIPNTLGINGNSANTLNQSYLSESLLNYNTLIGKNHKIDALVGFTYQYAKSTLRSFRVTNIPQAQEVFGIESFYTGIASSPNTNGSHWQMYSFLSRLNYTAFDKYLFTVSARSDGSSKFVPGKQWGFFPSGAFAWRFSQEPFMKGLSRVLNDGKLRVSYGSVGNNKVGDFSYLSQMTLNYATGYPFNNNYSMGLAPFFYGNNQLTWETTTELDLGINLSFLNNRISVEADYYNKKTDDFLVGVAIASLAGYSNGANTQFQNTGSVENKGFELTINSVNIRKKNFIWSTDFNIAFNKNTILDFYDGYDVKTTPWAQTGNATAWIAKKGGSISQFYGYRWDGVYQYSDFNKLADGTYLLKNGLATYASNVQPGDPKYLDLNNDGIVNDDDQTVLGTPLPRFTGGFSNNFTYKNFTLNIFMQYSYGSQILNANKVIFEAGGFPTTYNQFATVANRWTPTNPTNDIPRARFTRGDAGSSNYRMSSRYIEDGSFIRLKTIALGYALPNILVRKLRMNNLSFVASAQNIFTITKYSGQDPEVSTYRTSNGASGVIGGGGDGYTYIQPSSGYTALAGGYDFTPYPRTLTISLGLKATF